jgi:uncharacterized cofD-like protein
LDHPDDVLNILPAGTEGIRTKKPLQGIGISRQLLKEEKIKSIGFKPNPSPNPEAIKRILDSDLVLIAPGDIYTSILPNVLVPGMADALRDSKSKKVYIF